jgi:hypothetical protein
MAIISFIGFIAVSLLSHILNGFALTVLWGWFIVPVFGLPVLAIVPAIGLALVAGFLTHQVVKTPTGESLSDTLVKCLTISLSKPILFLLIGWIVTLFL